METSKEGKCGSSSSERLARLETWVEVHRNQKAHTVTIWASVIVITAAAFGSLWLHQNDGHPTRVEARIDYHKIETREARAEIEKQIRILEARIRKLEIKNGSQ